MVHLYKFNRKLGQGSSIGTCKIEISEIKLIYTIINCNLYEKKVWANVCLWHFRLHVYICELIWPSLGFLQRIIYFYPYWIVLFSIESFCLKGRVREWQTICGNSLHHMNACKSLSYIVKLIVCWFSLVCSTHIVSIQFIV